MKKLFVSVFIILTFLFAQTPVYLDSTKSVDERVEDLLGRMTLAEKVGQMTQADHGALSNRSDVKNFYLGSILSGGGSDPAPENLPVQWTDLYDDFQSYALQTRLKIPMIYGIDAVHGHSNVVGATIFPHNIGLGATRNPDLIEEAGRVTAVEIAATGIDWTFAPCVAVPQDERWGRTYEGFGEVPELAATLGSAFIRGLQTSNLNNPTSIVACAKHYVGDGGTTNGTDQGNTEVTEQELREVHLPGYIAAIENDVKTIMASYNSWNGDKLHGSSYLLNDVLKDELGFKGFIVSDWAAIDQLPGDYKSDVEQSINAGIDMVMVPNNYMEFITDLAQLVNEGKVSMDRIDDAVSRILRVKFELGLFERPYANRSYMSTIGNESHRAIARQCVRESQVILKKNDDVLPLPKDNVKILVAGEHADNIGLQCGGWTIQWQGQSGDITDGTTILDGLRKVAPQADIQFDANGDFADTDADFAIVVIGEEPYAESGGDKSDLRIIDTQVQLVCKMKKLGMPVITLLISGRPMIIDYVLHNTDVFVASFLPGTEGDGIAEILFGDYAPSGISSVTWQKSNDAIPMNWGDFDYDPLFPFGFGITSFDNSITGSAPIFQSAMINEAGNVIEVAFNKSLASAEDVLFSVNDGNVAVNSIRLSENDDKTLLLETSEALTVNGSYSISLSSGSIKSQDGGSLDALEIDNVLDIRNYSPQLQQIPGTIQAEDYDSMSGIDTETTTDIGGGINVGWIDNNDWMSYNCNVAETGTYDVDFRVAAQSTSGKIKFMVDGVEKFSITLPVTGGWQSWQTVTQSVELSQGEHTIRIYAETGGFNLNWMEFTKISTSIENEIQLSHYKLENNYPNPFNPSTTISYSLPERSVIELNVFDIQGNKIETLVSGEQNSGNYLVKFESNGLPSGIYFYRLKANKFSQTKQMLLIK